MIYIEPTPYIVGLVEEVTKQAAGRVDVVFLRENATQQWNLSISGLNAQILPGRLFDAVFTLFRTIIRGSYKVVHLAGWSEIPVIFALFVACLFRLPVVIESDTPLPGRLPIWKGLIKRTVYPVLFRIPRMLLPGGSRQAAYLRHYGVKDERILIAGMTVDVTHIIRKCLEIGEAGRNVARTELGFSESDVVFVFVGRLLEWKGVENLLESFEIISSKHIDVRLIIAGDGPLQDKVAQAARRNRSIRYMGRLDSAGITGVLHASDVAVVPSHREPWGLVVNEAMAAGLPVIATDSVGCVDDLVIENVTGKVIRTNDRDALIAAMNLMAENEEERTRMGKEGRKLIADWTLEREARIIRKSWLTITAG